MSDLRLLDLFSGIGGFSYAAETLVGGFKTVQFVEIDTFCQKVLQKHWPLVPIHSDVCTFTAEPGSVDVITAGFPCQDISSAGKQGGLAAPRSGLFYEVIRLARELRPQFVVLENVANLVSHGNGETFQEVLFQIARAGFDAEWAVVSAQDVGACHLRKRIWIVAHTNNEGSQGQRPQRELGAGSSEKSSPWRGSHRLSGDWRSYLSQPVLCRGDDGLQGRVDRLKALGNSVVPQVAAIPMRRVRSIYEATQ